MSNDTVEIKHCPRCEQDKPATGEFWYKDKTSSDGWFSYCKDCKKVYAQKYTPMDFKYPLSEKKCGKCNQLLPATPEYFYRMNGSHSGLGSMCIECVKQYVKEYDYTEARKRYFAKNRKRNKNADPYKKGGEKICPDCNRELPITHFHKNKARHDGLRNICKDCSTNRALEWLGNNREKANENTRNWQKRNPEKLKIRDANKRARLEELPSTFTSKQWLECLEYFNYTCPVCGSQLRDLFGNVEPHADHWIPISYDGDDNPGTVAKNMVCLCNTCNLSKNATLPDGWLKSKFGTRKANEILARIEAYFQSLTD